MIAGHTKTVDLTPQVQLNVSYKYMHMLVSCVAVDRQADWLELS